MDSDAVKTILNKHSFQFKGSLKKLAVGFTNDVYDIDDSLILKVSRDERNEPFFKREAVLYNFFAGTLPVPLLIAFDDSREVINRPYMLYPKIQGDNLYNVWHTYSREQRRFVIKQLCEMLKIINHTVIGDLPKEFNTAPLTNWKEKVLSRIDGSLTILDRNKTLNQKEIDQVREFASSNKSVLDEQKMGLVYWDAHFDNIVVESGEIVGLLDFERTEYESIDYVLDIVLRMKRYPKKYMSEYAEQFAKKEDYHELMDWYEEFYPELFQFSDLAMRLNFYDLAKCLEDLEEWPEVEQLKVDIRRITTTD